MDKAEELLNTLDVNDENLYPVSPYEEAHIVIGKDRVITVPPDLRRLGVQYDKNVESVTFDCPRYWDGIDLLNMAMYINYIRSDRKTGSYHVADTAVVPDDEGGGTIASGKYQHVQGKYNVEDADNKYAHILGGGSDANNRKNIHTVDWDGNAEYRGDVTVHYGDSTIPIGAMLNELIDNPYMHRNVFRGKNLGEFITDEQLAAIRDGSFDDLYVGDYWEINGLRYRIADINYWKGVGYQESVQKPHILIVPDTALGSGQMHTSNSTSGGYKSSTMKTVRLNQIANSLPDVFKKILISHRMFSDGTWINVSVDLMNEVMVHGTYICTDNSNKQTSDTQQLALFRIVPELKTIGANYWLRNLSSAQTYTLVSQYGDASNDMATSTYGIRPVFGIG